jgi:NhaP-type Na+/H+ or K+/H+ antiporter
MTIIDLIIRIFNQEDKFTNLTTLLAIAAICFSLFFGGFTVSIIVEQLSYIKNDSSTIDTLQMQKGQA